MIKSLCILRNSIRIISATLIVIAFTSLKSEAQIAITGVVKDATGISLQGVTVQIKNDISTGTFTNSRGIYNINVPSDKVTLIFSYISYESIEIPVKEKTVINVVMNKKSSFMDEVIVTGYTKTLRKDLTGSIATVDMEDLQKAPVKSFEDALAGRIAGVQVTSQSGRPGSPIDIVIRGVGSISQSNKPLFVIDGFPMESPDNNLIDPDNIESITVLKDASATALYGSRGSNGVIIITTKRGAIGGPIISYSGNYGIDRVEKYLKMMSPYEFVRAQSDYLGAANPYLQNGKVLQDYQNVGGVDWQDLLLRTGYQQNHSLIVSGGSRDTKYSFSGNYFNQDGIIINSGFRRYQGKMTLDQNIGRAKIGGAITYTSSKTTGYDPQGSGGANSLFYQVFTLPPITVSGNDSELVYGLYNPDGSGITDYRVNPILSAQNQIRIGINNNISINLYANYNITKHLQLQLRGTSSNTFYQSQYFNGSKTGSGGPYGSSGVNGGVSNYRYDNYGNTDLLNYTNTFNNKHHLNIVFGAALEYGKSQGWGYSSIQLPVESLGISGIDAGTTNSPPTGYITMNSMASLIASVAYNFKDKYYVTGNFREDGSSKFIGNNKVGYFPSGAVKWKFTNEGFFPKNKFISDGSIRFSYGTTGNNRVSDFASYSSIVFRSPLTINGVTQGNSAMINSLQNPALHWERTTEKDLGIDLSFFNNNLHFTADLYDRFTDKLLYNTQLPQSTGYSSTVKNIASITNRGLEMSLNAQVVKKKNFSYSASFNISFNRNRLDALSDPNEIAITTNIGWEALFASQAAYIAKVGGPLGQMYGLISDGLYQYKDFDRMPNGTYILKPNEAVNTTNTTLNRAHVQPGDSKYVDINNDGQITSADYVVLGNGYPLHAGGWSNNFRYKHFDLNVFFQWSYGNSVIDANRLWFSTGMGIQQRGQFIPGQEAFAEFEKRWTPTNQNTDIPAMNRTSNYYSSQFVEDGSYLRLKTLNIGYNVSANLLKKYKISTLRFYVSTQNIFTLTKYKGYDPELSAYQTALSPSLDYSTYPRPFTIVFGLNLKL